VDERVQPRGLNAVVIGHQEQRFFIHFVFPSIRYRKPEITAAALHFIHFKNDFREVPCFIFRVDVFLINLRRRTR
jgi:hypothetical protein